jgi:hypothetical protein
MRPDSKFSSGLAVRLPDATGTEEGSGVTRPGIREKTSTSAMAMVASLSDGCRDNCIGDESGGGVPLAPISISRPEYRGAIC